MKTSPEMKPPEKPPTIATRLDDIESLGDRIANLSLRDAVVLLAYIEQKAEKETIKSCSGWSARQEFDTTVGPIEFWVWKWN